MTETTPCAAQQGKYSAQSYYSVARAFEPFYREKKKLWRPNPVIVSQAFRGLVGSKEQGSKALLILELSITFALIYYTVLPYVYRMHNIWNITIKLCTYSTAILQDYYSGWRDECAGGVYCPRQAFFAHGESPAPLAEAVKKYRTEINPRELRRQDLYIQYNVWVYCTAIPIIIKSV